MLGGNYVSPTVCTAIPLHLALRDSSVLSPKILGGRRSNAHRNTVALQVRESMATGSVPRGRRGLLCVLVGVFVAPSVPPLLYSVSGSEAFGPVGPNLPVRRSVDSERPLEVTEGFARPERRWIFPTMQLLAQVTMCPERARCRGRGQAREAWLCLTLGSAPIWLSSLRYPIPREI